MRSIYVLYDEPLLGNLIKLAFSSTQNMDYNITDMNQNNTQPAPLVQTSVMKLTEISYVILQEKHVSIEI